SSMDQFILVVCAASGVAWQTREHILFVSQICINKLVLFINKCDTVEQAFIELVIEECKELLESHDYKIDERLIFCGSALKALQGDEHYKNIILQMVKTMGELIPEPTRDVDKDFKMYIEKPMSISGRGTVVTGAIESGLVSLNEELELIGGGRDSKKVVVTGIEMFNKSLTTAQSGDNCGLLLRGLAKEDVQRGMVLCKPGSVGLYQNVKAEIYVLKGEEGGRRTPILSGYRPQFFTRTLDVTGSVTLSSELLMPGETGSISVEFHHKIPISLGDRFVVREGGKTVFSGTITGLE
ncbi:MAG: EF-Tu/IF-2/RF-3 family GTPase, partial [Bacteroidota bacterium]